MEQCVSLLSTSSGRQKFNVSFTNNFISIRDWSYRFTKYCLSLIFKSNSLLWALPIVLISSHSLSLYRRLHTFKLLTYSSHWLCPPVLNMSEHILFNFQRYVLLPNKYSCQSKSFGMRVLNQGHSIAILLQLPPSSQSSKR